MGSKKRKRKEERPTIHPRNKYSENPPDFAQLASLYPTFQPFVYYSHDGRPNIDWTDFNATRELTRVLLLHDHSLNWWIPDGQLCPTVPNRSNYIHWVEDLLSSDIIPHTSSTGDKVRGFDIGTGANCIYPLLGASLLGWSFVGSDVTDVAIEWASRNVHSNPHISDLIEIRKAESNENAVSVEACHNGELLCNETLEAAGLNPKTSCGGSREEMVCPGGEKAFITRIIEDSAALRHSFRWYTSMVGRKSNLKYLISKLWANGVTIVRTTEFVQGKTCRWGLAWSFLPPMQKKISTSLPEKTNMSFMLECIQRHHGAIHVLQAVESYFTLHSLPCTLNSSSFTVDVEASKDECDSILKNELPFIHECAQSESGRATSDGSSYGNTSHDKLCFRVSVFQQIPGTLLVKGSLQQKSSALSGAFSLIFQKMEEDLRGKFCIDRRSA
ncbi:uncharacterized protein LOC129292150 isoform X2 [Prosopis cineraria]|uniref:uncharacterized protein LOC129292150 isoform X2 n=1 Tax=Prosopis cineraria TaxID=364024 RepID=UPI002410AE8D|nr:uncharacterized protein LOC129292150 isoform X2 [Prosopis cineraria]